MLISILLHLTVFIFLSQMFISSNREDIQKKPLSIDFFVNRSPRPSPPPKKPPEPPVEKSTEKVPSLPKPTISQDESVFKIDQFSTGHRTVKASEHRKHDQSPPSYINLHPINTSKLIKLAKNYYQLGEQNIPENIPSVRIDDFDTSGRLADASPTLNRNVSKRKWGRGQGLRYYSYANTSSSSSGASKNEKTGKFYYMMLGLANDIAERAEKMVDVVFVLDTTGSMEDNIRGVRAYTNLFFEQLRLDSLDVAMGLVTFSDVRVREPDVYGVTTKIDKIRNKLFDIEFTGGSEIAESGLDALMAAVNEVEFRPEARKFFVLISDGTFHDADYDGQSRYSLDELIEILKQHNITVDVVGIDYLPVKQLAYGTGGNWRAIPGKGYCEKINSSGYKNYSRLGILTTSQDSLKDELIIHIDSEKPPDWIRVTYKLLNPLGEKCFENQVYKEKIDLNSVLIKLYPDIDINKHCKLAGTYTLSYRVENSEGGKSILRRMIDLHPEKRENEQ